jgi:ribosomal protein L11 methylase PrmA
MEKNTEKIYTEMEIRKLIQQEIKQCFEQLANDIKDIKQALLGNDYHKGGLVSMVQRHEEYIDKSETLNIIERAQPALEWYETWERNKVFTRIEEVLDIYGKWKWLIGLIAGGSLAGIVSAIVMVVELVKRASF